MFLLNANRGCLNKEIVSVGCFCLWNLQKNDFEGFLILNDEFLKSHFVLKESCS